MDFKNSVRYYGVAMIEIVWPWVRLYIYYYLVRTAMEAKPSTKLWKYEDYQNYHYGVNFFLISLFILNIFWEYKFLELAYGAVFLGK